MDFDKHMIETVAQGRSKRAAPKSIRGSTIIDLVNGKINPMLAAMQGKIKAKGDIDLARNIPELFGFSTI